MLTRDPGYGALCYRSRFKEMQSLDEVEAIVLSFKMYERCCILQCVACGSKLENIAVNSLTEN